MLVTLLYILLINDYKYVVNVENVVQADEKNVDPPNKQNVNEICYFPSNCYDQCNFAFIAPVI